MKGKLAIGVHNGVAGVEPALKADDDIRFCGLHIRYLAFSLVAPVGADNCCNHNKKHSALPLRENEKTAQRLNLGSQKQQFYHIIKKREKQIFPLAVRR